MNAEGDGGRGAADTLRRLVMPVYLPTAFGRLGAAMMVPVLPLYLDDAGLSLGTTSVVLAGIGIGSALGGLPSGGIIARFGERAALLTSIVVMAISAAPLGLTKMAFALVMLQMFYGAATVALRLSRQTYITRRVITEERGRALSLVGGSARVAMLIGPILGGVLVDIVGFAATFFIAAAAALIGLGPVLLGTGNDLGLLPEAKDAQVSRSLFGGLRTHWRRLIVAGWLPLLFTTVRSGRFVVLPLIADGLGLSATEVGAIVTVSTAADVMLFPAAGWIMDRFGRLASLLPAFLLIGIGLVWLGLADSAIHVILAGSIIGVGNGLSAGSMLTLGSDLAPLDSPGQFLAGMAVMQSAGHIIGPLLVGIVGELFGLDGSAIALAVATALAGIWLVGVIGETSQPERIRSTVLR